jgi:ketosteroid isomerase-like protein
MQSKQLLSFASLSLLFCVAAATADDSQALIELDHQWGAAGMQGDMASVEALLSDDLVSVTEEGVRGKDEELADNQPAPAGTTYEPTDYQVVFVNDDTAVMTHGTEGDEAHYSLHVWAKVDGNWQVVASSTTPAKSE